MNQTNNTQAHQASHVMQYEEHGITCSVFPRKRKGSATPLQILTINTSLQEIQGPEEHVK